MATNREVRGTQQITVRAPRDLHEAVKTLSLATGDSVNDIVVRAVRDYLGTTGHRRAVERFLTEAQDHYRVALDRLADL